MGKKKEIKVAPLETETPKEEVKKTHAEKYELKGKVKQMKQSFFKAHKINGEIVAGERQNSNKGPKNHLVNFYENGQTEKSFTYNVDGQYHTMTFNKNGDLD